MRLRSARGNSNTAVTFYIDYVKITVDYTVPNFVYGSAVLSGVGTLTAIGTIIYCRRLYQNREIYQSRQVYQNREVHQNREKV